MRTSVSFLVLCAGLVGCSSTSVNEPLSDVVSVTSVPSSAAVRLNGKAVGRTPTKITLDRTQNYQLEVGKGGHTAIAETLKPSVITTRDGIEFGFPATVNFNLRRIPGEDERLVPAGDQAEFKYLTQKALGEVDLKQTMKSDVADTLAAATKVKASLASREAASKAKIDEIRQAITEAKGAKSSDAASAARVALAENALNEATREAAVARNQAARALADIESRRLALAGSPNQAAAIQINAEKRVVDESLAAADAKFKSATTALTTARLKNPAGMSVDDRIKNLEKTLATEMVAMAKAQTNSSAAIQGLEARTAALARLATLTPENAKKTAQAEAAKSLAEIQKSLEEQKTAAAKAREDRDAVETAATKTIAAANQANDAKLTAALAAANQVAADNKAASDQLLAEAKAAADAKLAEINKAAEKALADARLDAEAKLAEAKKASDDAAKAAADLKAAVARLTYSEFSARYALLEAKLRAGSINQEQYKEQLAALRKELGI